MLRSNATHASSLNDVPQHEHYVILREQSVHIPGDQRSIEAPGHGYPARDNPYLSYVIYADRLVWETEIKRLSLSGEKFKAITVTPAQIEVTHTVKVH